MRDCACLNPLTPIALHCKVKDEHVEASDRDLAHADRPGRCLLLAPFLGVFAYLSAIATPVHPNPQDVPSVTRSAPLPQWADAVEHGRQIVARWDGECADLIACMPWEG